MAAVNLVNVSKYQGQQLILDNINFSIEAGEFIVVVGPSGCGKSTLLRLIAGLDTVSSGEILINDRCVNSIPPAQRDMAMVFQSYALYPHMTVYNNMAYSLKMRGMKKTEIEQRVQETASMLRLTDCLQRKPQALSGGQRQRVAMGRAMVRSPSVFLFDEPLSNLDAKLRFTMRHEIKKLHQQLKTTCIYVTHDQTEAMTMAQRVVVLNQGKMEQFGTPKILYQQPASLFVADFTAPYPLNLISATVDTNKGCIQSPSGLSWALPKLSFAVQNGESVVVAIRAEDIQLVAADYPESLNVTIDFVDEMGADILIQARSLYDQSVFTVRATADKLTQFTDFALVFPKQHSNLYHKASGLYLGGWR